MSSIFVVAEGTVTEGLASKPWKHPPHPGLLSNRNSPDQRQGGGGAPGRITGHEGAPFAFGYQKGGRVEAKKAD